MIFPSVSGFGSDWVVMLVPAAPPPIAELLGVLVDHHTLCPLSYKTERPCQLLGLAGTGQKCFVGVGCCFLVLNAHSFRVPLSFAFFTYCEISSF